MGRSFYRPAAEHQVEAAFYHRASDRHYRMYRRDGKYYQRRHQIVPGGDETNVLEKQVHYVLGSGNHSRAYLHRNAEGRLVELPLAWYSAKGGFWAMNPGYDRPNHKDFRRELSDDCMFCHNGYPAAAPAGSQAEGIDCQRCHGPGSEHAGGAGKGAIVNPRKLSRERQLEVCMQCHLESTSRRLPYSIRRYDRDAFSYRPGEPLADYILHFDHPAGAGPDDKFEIAHHAYRLRKSACFEKSEMTCTTCHDPHSAQVRPACANCHPAAHRATEDCAACHMPKRRTDDVVHVVMTDHYIQRRRPARNLLAPLRETHETEQNSYTGEVVPYYPSTADELYAAVAQVTEGANLQAGIPRLEKAIEKHRPPQAEFYYELAEAFWKTGRREDAVRWYEEALRRRADFRPALRNLAVSLSRTGRPDQAVEVLRRTVAAAPRDAEALSNLGEVYLQLGKADQAIEALSQALRIQPDLPEAANNLGEAKLQKGDRPGAEQAFREAIRIQPDLAAAHNNLANLLAAADDFAQARHHFEKAIGISPGYAEARYNYGLALAGRRHFDQAQAQLEAAVRLDPNLAEAHNNLGNLLAMKGDRQRAAVHYRRAIEAKPGLAAAHLNLGRILAAAGNREQALVHFRKAAESPDPEVREAARAAIREK